MQLVSEGLGGAQLITSGGGLWHRAAKALICGMDLLAKGRVMAPSQPLVPGHTLHWHRREGEGRG